jgi:Flp pilus assembly protein TadD
MIMTSDALVEELKETAPNKGFRVQPPNNPLVATSGLSLHKKDDGMISIEWDEEAPTPNDDLLTKVREEFVSRSRKDVSRHPNSARVHANLGIALMNQGMLEDAVREFELALSINPRYYVAGITLAKIMVEQNRLEDAERLYLELQEAFPEDSAPTLSLAFIAMKRLDFESAERLFRRALLLVEDAVLPRYLLAIVLLRLGRNREAISLLKASVRSEVRAPALYQALGVAYAMSGDRARAELNFRTALTLAPAMGEAVHGLARVLIEGGKADAP